METRLTIVTELAGAEVSGLIFGHFAEHLGRSIYGGIWLGRGSEGADEKGYNARVKELLRDLGPEVLRWPGGCFGDQYHWEEGVGKNRRVRRNIWWGGYELHEFGTDEFLGYCEEIGAEPYICLNLGTGTVREALDWMEYVLGERPLSYAERRAENGREEPYKVRYWGLGNETWGCGGNMRPEYYADLVRQYSNFIKATFPDVKLVAVGHTTDWNRRFVASLLERPARIDALSVHQYTGAKEDWDEEDYRRCFGSRARKERQISEAWGLITALPGKLKLVVDEWGVWYDTARRENGLLQRGHLKDALSAASDLHLYMRHADKIEMANIAQTVNVLHSVVLAEGPKAKPTPTYFVFKMLKGHKGGRLLPVVPEGERKWPVGEYLYPLPDVVATVKGNEISTSLLNPSEEDIKVELSLSGGDMGSAEAVALVGSDLQAEDVELVPAEVSLEDGRAKLKLGPASLTMVRIERR
ncbi:MAG: alpha-N-arabinofuranosidase [Candidatus Latescibacterota bacterium]|nr:MAG: alpha-N-arabinofuranosidase [Candidatus Latescibacterota bacterium]